MKFVIYRKLITETLTQLLLVLSVQSDLFATCGQYWNRLGILVIGLEVASILYLAWCIHVH